MQANDKAIWQQKPPQQLAEVLVAIHTTQDMQAFLRDVMTPKEIIEISARLEAAKMLAEGKKYTEIASQTKLSSRTIARISDWLKNGNSGYKNALANKHTSSTHTK